MTAQAANATGYSLGLCWTVSVGPEQTNSVHGVRWSTPGGQATYMLHVSPGTSSAGTYRLLCYITSHEVIATSDSQSDPWRKEVNLLDPANVKHRSQTAAIHPATAANVLTVVRRAENLRIFVNDELVNDVNYTSAPFDSVSIFIAGQLAAEFRRFTVRVAKQGARGETAR